MLNRSKKRAWEWSCGWQKTLAVAGLGTSCYSAHGRRTQISHRKKPSLLIPITTATATFSGWEMDQAGREWFRKKRNTAAPEETWDSRIPKQVFHNGTNWDLARSSRDVSAPGLRQLPLAHSMLVLTLLGSLPKLVSIPSSMLVSLLQKKGWTPESAGTACFVGLHQVRSGCMVREHI